MPFARLKLKDEGFINPRTTSGLDHDELRELAIHIGLHGLLVPLLVTKHGLVLAGQRRYIAIDWLIAWCTPRGAAVVPEHWDSDVAVAAALEEVGHEALSKIERRAHDLLEGVPVRIIDDGEDLDGVALADNVLREGLSSFEIAATLTKMSAAGKTGTELARMIGKSTSYVSRKLSWFRLSGPALKKAWESGQVNEDQVEELCKLPAPEQAKVLAGPVPRGRRGATNRPGIDTVKQALDELVLAGYQKQNPQLEVGVARYAAGVADALAWVTGEQASQALAKLLNGENK